MPEGPLVLDMEYYDDIIRAREAIKRKYNALRRGETEKSARLEKHFKPVAEPLKAILKMKDQGGPSTLLLPVKKEEPPPLKTEDKEEPEKDDDGRADIDGDDTDDDESSDGEIFHDTAADINDDSGADAEEVVEGNIEAESSESPRDHALLDSYIDTNFGPLYSSYFRQMITGGDAFDHTHGVRLGEGGRWMLGNKPLRFDKNDNLIVGEHTFEPSPGLLELIFKRSPGPHNADDVERYKRILELTNAHRQSHEAGKPLRATSTPKYKEIIRPLYLRPRRQAQKRTGKGLQGLFGAKRPRTGEGRFVPMETRRTFVYWDDPNELVERLALLAASRDAGHTGLEREILSIEEELREGGYIL